MYACTKHHNKIFLICLLTHMAVLKFFWFTNMQEYRFIGETPQKKHKHLVAVIVLHRFHHVRFYQCHGHIGRIQRRKDIAFSNCTCSIARNSGRLGHRIERTHRTIEAENRGNILSSLSSTCLEKSPRNVKWFKKQKPED